MDVIESSAVSVDVVALWWPADRAAPLLGLTRRAAPPFEGEWALPGVLLGRGERLSEAAVRAVRTKLGVEVTGVGQLRTFDEPLRDPRGPTLSIAQWAVVAPNDPGEDRPDQVRWESADELPSLAFDHNRIVTEVLPDLAGKLWQDETLTRALLGDRFTLGRAVAASAALTGQKPDPANLHRQLRKDERLRRDDDATPARTGGRPAAWWTWV